jgi:hypothetical protein
MAFTPCCVPFSCCGFVFVSIRGLTDFFLTVAMPTIYALRPGKQSIRLTSLQKGTTTELSAGQIKAKTDMTPAQQEHSHRTTG